MHKPMLDTTVGSWVVVIDDFMFGARTEQGGREMHRQQVEFLPSDN